MNEGQRENETREAILAAWPVVLVYLSGLIMGVGVAALPGMWSVAYALPTLVGVIIAGVACWMFESRSWRATTASLLARKP